MRAGQPSETDGEWTGGRKEHVTKKSFQHEPSTSCYCITVETTGEGRRRGDVRSVAYLGIKVCEALLLVLDERGASLLTRGEQGRATAGGRLTSSGFYRGKEMVTSLVTFDSQIYYIYIWSTYGALMWVNFFRNFHIN
jgi:hypothetical protein